MIRFNPGVLCAWVLLLAGCFDDGLNLADVKGIVTLDGQPVPGIAVTFSPIETGMSTSSSMTDEEGRFHLKYTRNKSGAFVGQHRVIFENVPSDNPQMKAVKIPKRFMRPGHGITAQVEPGPNFIELKLNSKEG